MSAVKRPVLLALSLDEAEQLHRLARTGQGADAAVPEEELRVEHGITALDELAGDLAAGRLYMALARARDKRGAK